jgi:hypothetical protein
MAKLKAIKNELRRRMPWPIPEQGRWLKQVLTGASADHAVPTNDRSRGAFRDHIIRLWAQRFGGEASAIAWCGNA